MPKLEEGQDKLDRRLTLRLTTGQYEGISREADLAKLPIAVYARHLVLSRNVKVEMPIVLDPKGIEPAIAALGRVGNNINQIARWLNRHTSIDDGLRAEAREAFVEVAECARALTQIATEGVRFR